MNYDVITIPLGGPNRATWFEFTTPVVIKGRYKVWVCYRTRNAVTCNVRVNGELMQRPVNLANSNHPAQMQNWNLLAGNAILSLPAQDAAAEWWSTIDITTTQRQKLRIEPISGTNAASHIDMVHFYTG